MFYKYFLLSCFLSKMLYYKVLYATKYLLILISSVYIVTTIWITPNELSFKDNIHSEHQNNETNWFKAKSFYILSIIFSDIISLVGIMGALTENYMVSMVSSISKAFTLIISLALMIRPPLICLLLNILMSLCSFLFAFMLWIKLEWLIEAKVQFSQEFQD